MLCSVCQKNEAKVHLTQTVEGKDAQKRHLQVHLCEDCAKEKGIGPEGKVSLFDLLRQFEKE